MKNRTLIAVLFLLLFIRRGCEAASIALTSIGQNSDVIMAKALFKSLNAEVDSANLMQAKDLQAQKALVAVVGASNKGMSALGTNRDKEAARANELFDRARAKGMKILVMCIGGANNRGRISDFLIEKAAPRADALILVEGVNEDGFFDVLLKDKNIKRHTAPDVKGVKQPLQIILREWALQE